MTTPSRRPQAVLWDMDGLLVDSEPVWTIAENELATRLGAVFTPAMKATVIGKRLDASVPLILRALHSTADAAEVSEWLLARMVALFADAPPVSDGALELLTELAAADVPCALVSSSYRVLVDAVLAHLPAGAFAATLAGDEVEQAKPHPEPYLRAAEMLGVDARRCVVLEDSETGARAGAAAGCAVVVVPSVVAVVDEPAWTVVTSLREVNLARLASLVR